MSAAGSALAARPERAAERPPNIVLIVCDDLGYGDTGPYGGCIPTPHLARMAGEGIRFTHYLSAAPVCSASRAAYLTGRYGQRSGTPDVFWPHSSIGMDVTETTMADMLRSRGYRTMCVGKWHLGDAPQFLPTSRGFDDYLGIPYSVDMTPRVLMQGTQIVDQNVDLNTLTARYTEKAVSFIEASGRTPFFLYLPHSMPHIPQGASSRFRGKSRYGMYGDVVEEIDWSVGEIFSALKRTGVDRNTLVMFSSDHGPWFQGSPGRLRGRKGTTYEGGMRVPFYASYPGRIPPGAVCRGVTSSMDILPTVAGLCGAPLPKKPLDGIDAWPLLSGRTQSVEREALLYFMSKQLQCARQGKWKLHAARFNGNVYGPRPVGGLQNIALANAELYEVEGDVDESYDVAHAHPEIVEGLAARMETLIAGFPENIRQAWSDTKARKDTEPRTGALPRMGTAAPHGKS